MKNLIHRKCINLLKEKINLLQGELNELKENQIAETKSSMGDKYEITQEIINIEKGKLSVQFTKTQRMLAFLSSLDPNKIANKVEAGALVKIDQGIFYLSVSYGKIQVQSQSIFIISLVSPIAQAMLGKQVKEEFTINGKKQKIIKIE